MNQYKKLITPLIFCFSSLHAWDALADFPGPERLNPSIINFNEKIYVIGGDENLWPQYPLFDVWVYDIELNSWEEKNQLPSNLNHMWWEDKKAFFVATDDMIYGMFKNKLYKYFPLDDNWVLFNTSYPGDGGGLNHKSPYGFSDGNNLYVGFGYRWSDGYYLGYYYLDRDIYKFDTSTSTWSWFDEWDDSYIGSKISTINDNIYIIAGYNIYSYDISEKTMNLIAPIPLEYIELNEDNNGQIDYGSYISNLGFIAIENSLHLLGGYAYNIDGYEFHEQHLYQNDHFEYSFSTNSWSFEDGSNPTNNPDYPGRGNPSLTSIGNDLYLGFGTGNYFENLNPDGNYAHNDLWVLNTSNQNLGDINDDGIINVLDIVRLVNDIISGEDYNPLADLNFDNTVDVLDVLQLVDVILS